MRSRAPGAMLRSVGLRCLIVDDSAGYVEAARAFLEQDGIRVVGVASTAEEAARCVSELSPDITLVDIDLCGSSGIDVARRLVTDCCETAGCVILISAHAEEEFADLIEACPAAGFLPKSALSADAVRAVMRDGRSAPPGSSEHRET
jgi:two-component system, NarL family, nitrate/nitrite response regulator NarL